MKIIVAHTPSVYKQSLFSITFATADAGAVETMGAHTMLGHAYGADEVFDFVEFQSGDAELMGNFLHHALIFGTVGGGVLLQVLVGCPFEIVDDEALVDGIREGREGTEGTADDGDGGPVRHFPFCGVNVMILRTHEVAVGALNLI